MIISKLTGGLGNQMFQYALAFNLANRNQKLIKFDLNDLLNRAPYPNAIYHDFTLDIFDIACKKAEQHEIDRFLFNPQKKLNIAIRKTKNFFTPHYIIKQNRFSFEKTVFEIYSKNIYLEGFWQSEKYFKNIATQIKELYSLKTSDYSDTSEIAKDILNSNSVCVHLRKTDYTLPENIRKFGIFGADYYYKGLEIISSKINNLKVFVFSDDIKWCEENINFNFPTVFMNYKYEGQKNVMDFKLMCLCKNFVIPNSTFAWWAAWLCSNHQKIVVAPEKWFATDDLDYRDVVPENWIKI